MGFSEHLAKIEQQDHDARSIMLDFLTRDYTTDKWKGLMAVPPDSMLDIVLSAFKKETDIPLEIPFFAMLHFVSGYLMQKRVTISGSMGTHYSEIWTIVLAQSGSGKTFAHDIIAAESPVKSLFPCPASSPKFIESFQEHNFGLWFQDEIAQIMKRIETVGGPLNQIKEYLLLAYGNAKIERATKVETITIDTPCLGILGLNTPKSFFDSISPASLLDGFMQRFSFVMAEPDPERSVFDDPHKYANYDVPKLREAARKAFGQLNHLPIHQQYTTSKEAETAYKTAFANLITTAVPISFFRRVMFKSYKYALLYHIILGKDTPIIDAEDMAWGVRVSRMHLENLRHLVKADADVTDIAAMLDKAKKVQQKLIDQGKPVTARALQQGIRGINALDAKALLSMLPETPQVPSSPTQNDSGIRTVMDFEPDDVERDESNEDHMDYSDRD